MRVEALVSTMDQIDHSIVSKMNIQTDALVVNQCNHFGFETFVFKNHNIQFYSFPERGVGLSRNSLMMRTKADIVLFSDDDLVYVDGYETVLIKAFEENPKADIIIFNIDSLGEKKKRYMITQAKRIREWNYMRYGTARIAVRIDRVKQKNISFSLLFGGGAQYGSGEDTLFLHDCLKAGLKIYGIPVVLAKIDDSKSSWFKGYDQKFYRDKGALFAALYGRMAWIYCFRFALTHKSLINKKTVERLKVIKWLLQGAKEI